MTIVFNLLIGFFASLIGTLPPGLLNLYAVKVNLKEGVKKAIIFSLGVCVAVAVYTLLGLLMSQYIQKHPDVVSLLQKIALGIFVVLSVYFFAFAKDTRKTIADTPERSKTGRWFTGVLMGFLNLLIFPYWVYISLTFTEIGWLVNKEWYFWFAVIGAVIGTFSVLMGYIFLSKPKTADDHQIKFNFNLIIGSITAIIAVITFGKIFMWW